MSNRYVTKNGRTMKRGLFSNGVWHCDCDPRMPAEKFQTKNGGKNHGRWFYTCQKPQPKKCNFFLWEDDAKVREEGAVLSNSRTEPTDVPPHTPKKIGTPAKQTKLSAQLPTPSTKSKTPVKLEAIPPPSTSKDDFDDWPSDADADADLASALDEFETPRKAARNNYDDSPTKKRTTSAYSHASSHTIGHSEDSEELFTTPSTSKQPTFSTSTPTPTTHLPTPTQTLTSSSPDTDPGPLALSALALLPPSTLSPTQTHQLTTLLNTHELRTAGIAKGRDIARLALQTKDRKIADLEARIKGLEVEKETMRNVVACLKGDIATSKSPKRARRSWGEEGERGSGKGGRNGDGDGGAEGSGGGEKYDYLQSGGWDRATQGRGGGFNRGDGSGRGNKSVV